MWRLTMSDGSALASPDLDEASRAAAIAAMASRLAAAGPRTRRRIRGRPAAGSVANDNGALADWPQETEGEAVAWPDPVSPDPLPAWKHWPLREHIATAGRISVLAAMGVCGFGLVVLAQSPSIAALFHTGTHRAAVQTAQAQLPAPPVSASSVQTGPELQPPAAPARIAAAQPDISRLLKPREHKPVVMAASASAAPASQAAAPVVHAARQKRAVAHAEPVVVARAEAAAVTHHIDDKPYELPRWLKQDAAPQPVPAPAPRVLVMSEPPHNLELPASMSAPPPQAKAPAPVTPPPAPPRPAFQRPAMVFASSGYPTQSPYGGPDGRGYNPYYANPYGSDMYYSRPYMPPPPSYYGQY